ncbi:MAG: MFS transporter [Holosporaceae bacterium]|jgi:PAT family beta-lactamase induction signal transducer AmpG|nr:MFS transporter [Holosporaceae bacterium]
MAGANKIVALCGVRLGHYFPKCCLGFSYGISFPLTLSVLDFWIKDVGGSNSVIGMFALLHWPFTCKFVLGALLENYDIPYLSERIGRIRSWIVASHMLLLAGIVGMAYSNPEAGFTWLILFASLASLGDGCKNVVLYPYQIQGNNPRGYVASFVGFGHRIGMIFIKVFTLYLAAFYDWKTAYLFAAVVILLQMPILLSFKPPLELSKTNPVTSFRNSLGKSIAVPFKKMMKERRGVYTLVILMLYKSADFMMQKMSKPFLMEIGFSKIDIANIAQLWGSTFVIAGGWIGGYLVERLRLARALILFGCCHAVTFSMYLILLESGASPSVLTWIISCEALTGGCVTTVFLAFIYATCQTGSMYALLWALHDISGMLFMGVSGILADGVGWGYFFLGVSFSYIIGLLCLFFFTHFFDLLPCNKYLAEQVE